MDSRILEKLEQKREKFLKEIYILLPKAKIRLDKDNLLSITISSPKQKIIELRDEFLELDEEGIGCRIKFGVTKIQIKNIKGVYESFDLEKELIVDVLLCASNFQVNRAIKWTEENGIIREAVINNIRITLGVKRIGMKSLIDLELET